MNLRILILTSSAMTLMPAVVNAASLYAPDSYQALTSDSRSFRVNDALTVLIMEASSAQSAANSTLDRQLSVEAGMKNEVGKQYDLGANLGRDSAGKGLTARSGNLQAQISVRVDSVAANGDLSVHGMQKITVNGETQTISVSGVVRPVDVTADNVVLSSRLVDSEITYSGKGFVDRAQQESWISRMFGYLGL